MAVSRKTKQLKESLEFIEWVRIMIDKEASLSNMSNKPFIANLAFGVLFVVFFVEFKQLIGNPQEIAPKPIVDAYKKAAEPKHKVKSKVSKKNTNFA